MSETEWTTWRNVNMAEWRWPHFKPEELACRGTGRLKIDPHSLDALEKLRARLGGAPMILNSAYRSPGHNRAVGGAKASQHLLAKAFDVSMKNHDPMVFENAAQSCGFRGIGHYPKHGFMHIDTRDTPARWNSGGWFEPREDSRFQPEPQPTPKRDAAKDAAAVVAGGAVVEAALREAAPLLPGDWSGYAMLLAVGLGAGVAIWRLTRKTSAEPKAE